MFEALFRLAEADGWPSIMKRIAIGKSTASRWQIDSEQGRRSGFNRYSFDELMSLEEVRSAVAQAALGEPEENATAWRAISGELSKILTPDSGWTLVRRLRRMRELGLLDPTFSLLAGVIEQRGKAISSEAPVVDISKQKSKSSS
jgi:hypothetical protein